MSLHIAWQLLSKCYNYINPAKKPIKSCRPVRPVMCLCRHITGLIWHLLMVITCLFVPCGQLGSKSRPFDCLLLARCEKWSFFAPCCWDFFRRNHATSLLDRIRLAVSIWWLHRETNTVQTIILFLKFIYLIYPKQPSHGVVSLIYIRSTYWRISIIDDKPMADDHDVFTGNQVFRYRSLGTFSAPLLFLSLPRVYKIKIQDESEISLCKILN